MFGDIEEQYKSLATSNAQIQDSVAEIGDAQVLTEELPSGEPNYRDEPQASWLLIKAKLNGVIENVPDGRTRAKYNRIDRRNIAALIHSIAADGYLGGEKEFYLGALALWSGVKNRRRQPTAEDVGNMQIFSSS
jgi:hypothetical protein